MTIEAMFAFAAAFFLLAATPGPGMAAILSRALGGGMVAGYAALTGLVIGDAVFLAAAIAGLSALATTLGPMFQVVKYAGAVYLIWLGIAALRAPVTTLDVAPTVSTTSLAKDVSVGLFVTLGNPKPILFYGALLPTFLDLATVSVADFAILMAIVIVVSVVVYGVTMLLMERARHAVTGSTVSKRLNQATGVMLIGSGVAVATR